MAELVALLPALAGGTAAAGSTAASIGPILAAAGGITSALGSLSAGNTAAAQADFEAKQLKQKGEAEFAIGQREAMEKRREKRLTLSRARAVAAASGAGVDDPTATEIMAGIEQQGEFNAMSAMYRGQLAQSNLLGQARARKTEGRQAQQAGLLNAFGQTIYGGAKAFGYG